MKKYTFTFLLAVILMVSCDEDTFFSHSNCLDGKGSVVSESRDLGNFHSIQNNTYADIVLTQGPVEEVIIEAQENILDELVTKVDNGSLTIKTRKCLEIDQAIKIWITIPEIHKLSLHGVGDMTAQNDLNLDNLDILLTGVGNVYLRGSAESLKIDLTGVGDVNAFDLWTDDCDVRISGVGNARVSVNDNLDVTISGVGSVFYRGNPSINTQITGSGELIKYD